MKLIADNLDLRGYMDEPEVAHKVAPASRWMQQVIDHYHKPIDAPRVRLGWHKTHKDFQLREAEVTLWGGINGHGKSQLVGHAMLDLMVQNERVCIASLELPVGRLMARMARQAFGHEEPSIHYIKTFHKWTDGRLWLYDHVGFCDPKTMLAVIRYARDKFGIQHFVIDNLAKVMRDEDDYNEQKRFVSSLCTIAHDTGVHIHLVLHVKKGKTEADVPGKFDIKGSGSITDLVDNVFIVWRNKPKEALLRNGEASNDPDCILNLEKQRNGETEGSYLFWFDGRSFQYLEDPHGQPKQYRVEPTIEAHQVEF